MRCSRALALIVALSLVVSSEGVRLKRKAGGSESLQHAEMSAGFQCADLSNPEHFVIDVRTQAEWDTGHLGCASLLTLHDTLTEAKVLELTSTNRDVKIFVYCRSGHRAGIAKGLLEGWGFTDVTNAGGYASLIEMGCSCEGPSDLEEVGEEHDVDDEEEEEVDPEESALAQEDVDNEEQEEEVEDEADVHSNGQYELSGKCKVSSSNFKCRGSQCKNKSNYKNAYCRQGRWTFKWCLTDETSADGKQAAAQCRTRKDKSWCNGECKCCESCYHACGRCP